MRIPMKHFPHRVTLRPIDPVGSSVGPTYGPEILNVEALVIPKSTQRTDDRPDSDTKGQLVATSAHVIMQPDRYVRAGSLIVLHPGRPNEETVVAVTTALFEHPKAPESAQAWTV